MRTGQLDRRITIQSATVATGGVGAETKTWSDYATGVPANVQTESARERIRAGRVEAAMAYIITIRYRDDITASMRVLFEGSTLNVHGVREIGRGEFLELTATLES